jgi:ABC-type amino acid transport substrate-binding protein
MKRQRPIFAVLIAALLLAFAQLAVATADAQQAADPRVADLAHAGKVRVGLFLPQYIKDTATGQLRSVWVEIARAFATRLGFNS